jgi:hypothetical protein
MQVDTIDLVDESPVQPSDDGAFESSHRQNVEDVEDVEDDEEDDYQRMAAAARRRANVDTDDRNPIIEVFVEPAIPDTMPVAVKIHYQQAFKEVRQSWCRTNIAAGKLQQSEEPDVIIKLNGRKVYDVQTCKSLGVGLDAAGLPTIKDAHGIPQSLEMVHIQATTRQLDEEERERRLKTATDEPEAPESPEEAKEPVYRLIMRSRDHDELKISVRKVRCVENHSYEANGYRTLRWRR